MNLQIFLKLYLPKQVYAKFEHQLFTLGIYLTIYYHTSSSSLRIISEVTRGPYLLLFSPDYLEFRVHTRIIIKIWFPNTIRKYLNENTDFQCNLDHMTLNENIVQMLCSFKHDMCHWKETWFSQWKWSKSRTRPQVNINNHSCIILCY